MLPRVRGRQQGGEAPTGNSSSTQAAKGIACMACTVQPRVSGLPGARQPPKGAPASSPVPDPWRWWCGAWCAHGYCCWCCCWWWSYDCGGELHEFDWLLDASGDPGLRPSTRLAKSVRSCNSRACSRTMISCTAARGAARGGAGGRRREAAGAPPPAQVCTLPHPQNGRCAPLPAMQRRALRPGAPRAPRVRRPAPAPSPCPPLPCPPDDLGRGTRPQRSPGRSAGGTRAACSAARPAPGCAPSSPAATSPPSCAPAVETAPAAAARCAASSPAPGSGVGVGDRDLVWWGRVPAWAA
jgi:hypothetical protein